MEIKTESHEEFNENEDSWGETKDDWDDWENKESEPNTTTHHIKEEKREEIREEMVLPENNIIPSKISDIRNNVINDNQVVNIPQEENFNSSVKIEIDEKPSFNFFEGMEVVITKQKKHTVEKKTSLSSKIMLGKKKNNKRKK
jgi:hypothetical protein